MPLADAVAACDVAVVARDLELDKLVFLDLFVQSARGFHFARIPRWCLDKSSKHTLQRTVRRQTQRWRRSC